ncbi:MAG TPA: hypothetical protein P5038_15425 [Candidatus Paceibacterota bacterium]|nr:hypothetical protein [Candidatus Paceibacterota bacterium]
MRMRIDKFFGLALAAALGMAPGNLGAGDPQPAKPAKPANPVTLALQAPIPKSVFDIPATPDEGRNPFFPNSIEAKPAPVVKNTTPAAPAIDTSALVLNGITSPPRRTAMVNGRTFEPGEEGEVKLPNGTKLLIQCAEIRDEAVVIVVGGVRKELKLRFAL